MQKQELIVAFAIAAVATLIGLALYLWLFDNSTGKLKTSVSRTGAQAAANLGSFLRKRALFFVALAVAAILVVIAVRYAETWTGLIRNVVGQLGPGDTECQSPLTKADGLSTRAG